MNDEIKYYTSENLSVTSHQIKSKEVTLMTDAVASVEYKSEGCFYRIMCIVVTYMCASGFLGIIFGEFLASYNLLVKIVVGGLLLIWTIGGLHETFVKRGALYVLAQGRRIKLAEGRVSEMQPIKQAIEQASLSNKTRGHPLVESNVEQINRAS